MKPSNISYAAASNYTEIGTTAYAMKTAGDGAADVLATLHSNLALDKAPNQILVGVASLQDRHDDVMSAAAPRTTNDNVLSMGPARPNLQSSTPNPQLTPNT